MVSIKGYLKGASHFEYEAVQRSVAAHHEAKAKEPAGRVRHGGPSFPISRTDFKIPSGKRLHNYGKIHHF